MPIEINSPTFTTSRPVAVSVETIVDPVTSGETAVYSTQLNGPGAAVIANTDFTAITLTLVDEETRAVVNSRLDQDVLDFPTNLGANNVALNATALLTWTIQSADTIFVDPSQTRRLIYYRTIFTFDFDIGAGTERGIHEVRIPIRQAFTTSLKTLS